MTHTWKIEIEEWGDRTLVCARDDEDGCAIAQGVFYTRQKTARIWDGECILADLKGANGNQRARVLYGTNLASVRALVEQAAAVAPVEALRRA